MQRLARQSRIVLCAGLLVLTCAGCARTPAAATDGARVHHPAGFSVVVPEGWTETRHDRGVRLVGTTREGAGYPTIVIGIVPLEDLPDGFLDGRDLDWPDGTGSYSYRRWSNPLGHGDALTVHLMTDRANLEIEVERWSDRIWVDRKYYRKEIWPILNSIEIED